MTKLQEAIAKLSSLPRATQDTIAEELLSRLDGIEHLRSELRKGVNSIDRGDFEELDIDELIRRARARYGQP